MNIVSTIRTLTFAGIFLALSSQGEASSQRKLEKKIEADFLTKNYRTAANRICEEYAASKSMHDLKLIAKDLHYPHMKRAINAANKSVSRSRFGISRMKYLQIALFAETELPRYIARKQYYFPKDETGLSHTLEYDPESRRLFILFESRRHYIGKGKKKKVYRSLCYNRKKPIMIARGQQSFDFEHEEKMTKLLQGQPGIFPVYGYGTHGGHSLYSKLFNAGSLSDALDKHTFSLREKIRIAHQIIQGVESMHKKKIVHRDLNVRNILVHIPKGTAGSRKIVASVSDIARAQFVEGLLPEARLQGNTTYLAPEGLDWEKISGDDYYRLDLFATGCIFYRLFYESRAMWQKGSFIRDERPLEIRTLELKENIRSATQERRRFLKTKKEQQGRLSCKQEFEYLTLRMLNIDPTKRPKSAKVIRHRLEKLLKRLH